MKSFFLLLVFLVIVGFVAGYRFFLQPTQGVPVPSTTVSAPPQQQKKVGIPVYMQIPAIGVAAKVEAVGLDAVGNMGVPTTNQTTAWYKLGPRPGEKGSAVIDGHLDTVTGAPAVFWNLAKLQKDDSIVITDTNNTQYTFSVISEKSYPYNKLPLQTIFGATDAKRLNLITCGGIWDKIHHNYSDRIVVYAIQK